MSGNETKAPFAGLSLADDLKEFEIPPATTPAKPDSRALSAMSERAGFPSREPRAPIVVKQTAQQKFDTRLTVRVTQKDKVRFEEIAYRLRLQNGEAFQRLLDAIEASTKSTG
jgi:hypothetical protein